MFLSCQFQYLPCSGMSDSIPSCKDPEVVPDADDELFHKILEDV